jgi:hypothetical protein
LLTILSESNNHMEKQERRCYHHPFITEASSNEADSRKQWLAASYGK